jgi:bacterioferritin (cytochrome b1)
MFEQLLEPIPLAYAADYFIKVKTAEWTEPPDMTGALEGMFSAPVEQVLAKLTEVITAKFRKATAYQVYAQSLNDVAWRAVQMEFFEHAEDELKGAEYYMKRYAALGGAIHLNSIEPPPASTDPGSIFTTMTRAEQEGIQAQRELRMLVGDENPMKVGVEEQLVMDQHHLDELWQMMPPETKAMLCSSPNAGLAAHEGTETPEEEIAEIPEQQVAEEAAGTEPEEHKKAMAKVPLLRMKIAAIKLGFNDVTEGAEMSAPSGEMSSGAGQEMMPTNYLSAELMGQQAQQANESEYYRNKLREAMGQTTVLQQQVSDAQMQLDQSGNAAAEAGAQIQQATMVAQNAQDEALRQSQLTANMRIGFQQLQQQLLEVASQDPAAMGGLPTQLPAGAGAGTSVGEPAMMPDAGLGGEPASVGGPAEQAPAAGGGAPPGSAPAGAGVAGGNGQPEAKPGNPSGSGGKVTVNVGEPQTKQANFGATVAKVAPYGLAGAALGAYGGYRASKAGPGAAQSRVAELEPQAAGNFRKALELAKAKAQAAGGEFAQQHSGAAMGMGALSGGFAGATMGPAIAGELGKLKGNLAQL